MNKKDKVLIIAAHPDDEVLGVGGTISKYAANGAEIKLLIVTDGSTAQYSDSNDVSAIINQKKDETKRAARILGISDIIYGNLPDMKLDTIAHIEINRVIENVISSFCPNIVFTHSGVDVNLDHCCVYRSTLVACRPVAGQCVKELYSYYVPSSTDWNVQNKNTFEPNVFVDITGSPSKLKYDAMACYSTEIRNYPHPRSIDALKILDKANGIHVGVECAESFVLHRWLK